MSVTENIFSETVLKNVGIVWKFPSDLGATRIQNMEFDTLAQTHLGHKRDTRCMEMPRGQESGQTEAEIHTREVHTGDMARR